MEELPVTGFRQHYFLGHDIVMLVSQSNLTRPFSQVLKWAFDQTAALVLVILLTPLLCALAIMVRRDGGPALFSAPPDLAPAGECSTASVLDDGGERRRGPAQEDQG